MENEEEAFKRIAEEQHWGDLADEAEFGKQKQSKAVEVFRRVIADEWVDNDELKQSLKKGLLALERIEAIELFVNRDKIAKEKYKVIIDILEGKYHLNNLRILYGKKEVREVLRE